MSDDPQGIELSGRPAVTKMSKKPLYVVAVMLLILAAALVWSVNFAHNPKEKEEQKKVEVPTRLGSYSCGYNPCFITAFSVYNK